MESRLRRRVGLASRGEGLQLAHRLGAFFGGQMRVDAVALVFGAAFGILGDHAFALQLSVDLTGFGHVRLLDKAPGRGNRAGRSWDECIRSLGACRKVRKMSS